MKRALAILLIAGTANAQSKRYPPKEEDLDEERDAYSKLWEDAIEPGKAQYDDLVEHASHDLERHTADARKDAEDLLDQATKLPPGEADAWAWLGLALESDDDWKGCRDALDRAYAIEPSWDSGPRRFGAAVATCRARAGDLDGAADVLERIVAKGSEDVEVVWRLGEVYMAEGRLDDARAALTSALDGSPADIYYVHAAWSLAVAADRARDPDASADAAQAALGIDPERALVLDVSGGFLPASDGPYYAALAADDAGVPEIALLEYRVYRALVAKGPWAERTDEHLKALDSFAIADRTIVSGTDPGDAPAIRKLVTKAEPALRACMAKVPRLLAQATITVVLAAKDTHVALPAAGVQVAIVDGDAGKDDSDAAIACVAKVAGGIALPKPTVAGTYTTTTFPVIAK